MMEENTELFDAAKTAEAWLSRWATHVGSCRSGPACTCGLTAVRSELAIAIQNIEFPPLPGDDL